jgi:dihydropteroate synthase
VRSKPKNEANSLAEDSRYHWRMGSRESDLSQKALVMGILNVTPDSFSDGGCWEHEEEALNHALQMAADGADIIDIGGESTRPGSDPVGQAEELDRVIPVIKKLSKRWEGVISVDTCKAEVAEAALAAGASVVNDISGLRDPAMVDVCAASDCGIVVMHMQGVPKSMQRAPVYSDVVAEVAAFFGERLATLTAAGIEAERLCWDPGIGFGKRLADNLSLLRGVGKLGVGGRPVMVGLSRKSFLGKLLRESAMGARDAPTVALSAWTRSQGARVHRVHEVKPNREAIRMTEAIAREADS